MASTLVPVDLNNFEQACNTIEGYCTITFDVRFLCIVAVVVSVGNSFQSVSIIITVQGICFWSQLIEVTHTAVLFLIHDLLFLPVSTIESRVS